MKTFRLVLVLQNGRRMEIFIDSKTYTEALRIARKTAEHFRAAIAVFE